MNRPLASRLIPMFALMLTVTLTTGCETAPKPMAGPQAVVTMPLSSGEDAALKAPHTHLINSKAELDAIGSEALSALEVDFAVQSVIIAAAGEQKAKGFWIRIDGVQTEGDTVWVQATVNRPQELGDEAMTYPYDAVVTEKIAGTVVPENTSVIGQKR